MAATVYFALHVLVIALILLIHVFLQLPARPPLIDADSHTTSHVRYALYKAALLAGRPGVALYYTPTNSTDDAVHALLHGRVAPTIGQCKLDPAVLEQLYKSPQASTSC